MERRLQWWFMVVGENGVYIKFNGDGHGLETAALCGHTVSFLSDIETQGGNLFQSLILTQLIVHTQ